MKRFIIYTDRQRKEIREYIDERPPAMPAYVRQLRMVARKTDLEEARGNLIADFEQGMKDLVLMKELAELEVPIGRKDNEYKELHAKLTLRRTGSSDKKASLRVRDR